MNKRKLSFALALLLVFSIFASVFTTTTIADEYDDPIWEATYKHNLRMSTEMRDLYGDGTSKETLELYKLPRYGFDKHEKEIIELAQSIVKGISNDYEKAKAIHDWVATNIWYDRDGNKAFLLSSEPPYRYNTLETKLGVCAMYAALTVDLLRAAGIPEVVTITASMGNQANTASLIFNPGASNNFVPGEDSYKLHTKYKEQIIDKKDSIVANALPLALYTYSSDGFPLEVNTFGDDNNIKLGISTSLRGEIELDFSGIEYLSFNKISLRDLETGAVTDLKTTPYYIFTKESEATELNNRFLLTFSGVTGVDDVQQGNVIVIFAEGNRLQVISNNSLLKSVQIFDLQGRLLQGTSPQSPAYSTTIDHQGIYVIKAQSETGSEVKKIIIGQ